MVQEDEKLVIVNAPEEWRRKLADDIKAHALDIAKIGNMAGCKSQARRIGRSTIDEVNHWMG